MVRVRQHGITAAVPGTVSRPFPTGTVSAEPRNAVANVFTRRDGVTRRTQHGRITIFARRTVVPTARRSSYVSSSDYSPSDTGPRERKIPRRRRRGPYTTPAAEPSQLAIQMRARSLAPRRARIFRRGTRARGTDPRRRRVQYT